MATTTNYGWTTPDDTALVKDGASAIRTLGSSVDTSVKSLNPGTTSGDLDYYTAATTKARIAKGTAGQVFTMNSGATAPEWQTLNTGGMTLISTTAMSGLTTITLSSISGSYVNLLLYINGCTVGSGGNYRLQVNPNASSTISYESNGTTTTSASFIGATNLNAQAATLTGYFIQINQYASSTLKKFYNGAGFSAATVAGSVFGGAIDTASAITSLAITNNNAVSFTGGTILLYGVK
jgi:hypothetical protein